MKRAAGRRVRTLGLRSGGLRLAGFVALLLASLGMGSTPPPVKVYIPIYETMCPDAAGSLTRSTWPELTAFAGRARFGPVQPGTCAWLPGEVRLSAVQLRCEHTTPRLSAPAQWAAVPGGSALCHVPFAQDFR